LGWENTFLNLENWFPIQGIISASASLSACPAEKTEKAEKGVIDLLVTFMC
jgi:hypothetical protein